MLWVWERHRRLALVVGSEQQLCRARSPFSYRTPNPTVVSITESQEAIANQIKNSNLVRLVSAYRQHGHKAARINPLATAIP